MAVRRNADADVIGTRSNAPNMSGDVTMMAWFRRRGTGGDWEEIIGIGDDSGDWQTQVAFYFNTNDDLELYHRGSQVAWIASPTIVTNRWYHIAFYGDMSASGVSASVMYDPVTNTEYTGSGSGGTAAITEDSVYLGDEPTGGGSWFNGSFAFCKIWERELTLNEVRTERWSGAAVNPANLWCAWDLYDNSDTIDRSGNGNTPSLTNVDSESGPPVSRYPSAIILPFVAPSSGTNIAAATEALTLTTYAASIQLDVNVNTSTEALTLTEFPASVGLDVNIQAGTEALTLNALASSIALDVNVSASTQALTLTEFPSTVSLDVDIQVGTEVLTLTALAATVSLDAGTIINASSVPLALVTNVAVINSTNVVITDVNTTESWADGTNGLVATGTGFV